MRVAESNVTGVLTMCTQPLNQRKWREKRENVYLVIASIAAQQHSNSVELAAASAKILEKLDLTYLNMR